MCDFIERKLPRSAAHADSKALKVLEPAVLNGVIYICASVKMAQTHFLRYKNLAMFVKMDVLADERTNCVIVTRNAVGILPNLTALRLRI